MKSKLGLRRIYVDDYSMPKRPLVQRFFEITDEEAQNIREREEAIQEALKAARAMKHGQKGRLI